MEILNDKGRWTGSVATVLGRTFEAGRQSRKIHASARTPVGAANRATDRAIRHATKSEQKARSLNRRVLRQLGLDREIEIWGKVFRVRATGKPRTPAKKAPSAKGRRGAKRPLATYSKPIRDSRGRVSTFMRVRYKGFRSKGWTAGMTAEHIVYIYRDDAIEQAAQGNGIISNMGVGPTEIAEGWRVLEKVEEAYRANAIVQHRMIVGLPFQLSPGGRGRVLERFCERAFGRCGLPYAAVPHKPDPGGDWRNFHGHIAVSTRPMERVGPHEWEVGQEKVNGLTDPQGLLRLRALFAAIVNQECRREGIDVRVTHQTYKNRGIDARRQEHMGPQLVALHRQGNTVDMAARNEAKVRRNEEKEARIDDSVGGLTSRAMELIQRQLEILLLRQRLARKLERSSRKSISNRAAPIDAARDERVNSGLARVTLHLEAMKDDLATVPGGSQSAAPSHADAGQARDVQPHDQAISAFATILMRGERGLDHVQRLDEPWQAFLLHNIDDERLQRAWFLRPKERDDARRSLADALGTRAKSAELSHPDGAPRHPSRNWQIDRGQGVGG